MTSRREDDDARMPMTSQTSQPIYDEPQRHGGYQRQGIAETAAKSFIRSIASSIGRILVRSITGRIR